MLDVQLTTNGTLLAEEGIDQLLRSGVDALIFSVDAHHQKSFDGQGRPEGYDLVSRTVAKVLQRRAQLGLSRPWVRLRASLPRVDEDILRQTKQDMRRRFPLADIFVVGRLHNFRDDQDSYPDLRQAYELLPCAYLTQRLAVFWDGRVTVCCMDYNASFDLGALPAQDLADIWLSTRLQTMRQAHLAGRRGQLPICRHCHACLQPRAQVTGFDRTPRHMADYQPAAQRQAL